MKNLLIAPLFAGCWLALFDARSSQAALPPLSDADRTAMATLIVDGDVIAVACGGSTETATGTFVDYIATVRVSKVQKGTADATIAVRTTQAFLKPGSAGVCSFGPLPKGWSGRLFLAPLSSGNQYREVYFDCHSLTANEMSRPEAAPDCAANDSDGGDPSPDADGGDRSPDAKASFDATLVRDATTTADQSSPAADAPDIDAGAGDTASARVTTTTSGCSCSMGATPRPTTETWAIIAAGLLLALRKKRKMRLVK